MVWTLLAFLCVLATKFLTSVRLRGLKAKLESIQPGIDELRAKLAEAEEEVEELRHKVTQQTHLLNALQDAVRNLEDSLKQPASDVEATERMQLMQTVDGQPA